jgi:hypothetical protein
MTSGECWGMTTQPPRHGLGDLVRTAHADAWQAEGRLRERHGGGVCAVRGARAMASGIRTPKWNNADVTHEQIDLRRSASGMQPRACPATCGSHSRSPWLSASHCLSSAAWAMMVSSGSDSGLHLFDRAGGVQVRRIRADERDRFVALDAAAFAEAPTTARAWLAPRFSVGGGRYRRQCAKRRARWACRHGHRHRSASRCPCPAGEGAVARTAMIWVVVVRV